MRARPTYLLGFAGRVDILINNAGVFPSRDVFELEFAEWKRILGINLDSQFLMAKAVMASMRENSWGRIVNLASNTLGLAVPNMVPYMTSKGAVVGFTRALATDLARSASPSTRFARLRHGLLACSRSQWTTTACR